MDPDLTSDLSQWDSHNQASTIQLAIGDLEEMSAGAHLVLIPSSQSIFYLFVTSSLKVTNLFDNTEPSRVNQLPLSNRGLSATETE